MLETCTLQWKKRIPRATQKYKNAEVVARLSKNMMTHFQNCLNISVYPVG